MNLDTEGISCCFDKESLEMYEDYRKHGLSETAVAIADSFAGANLDGSTVLEIGCGFGALALEFVKRGAARAVGIDLSPKMIQMAKSLAAAKELSARASFLVGDGARTNLPPSTTVVLDAVLCCYPDVASLVENSCGAAERYLAFSIPDDTRFLTRLMKLFLPLQGLVLRGDRFRFFVHPSQKIRGILEGRGFRISSRKKAGWIWSVYLFSRA